LDEIPTALKRAGVAEKTSDLCGRRLRGNCVGLTRYKEMAPKTNVVLNPQPEAHKVLI
jgi:hypothetical protein